MDLLADVKADQAGAPRDGRVEWAVQHPLPRLWADPVLLQAALRNLIGNAVKYSRKREVARIEIQPIQDERGVGLAISDNGVGFQMKYVDKLFGVLRLIADVGCQLVPLLADAGHA
jgi:chemotaxis family two-component system sensor kinase Cph1